MLRLEVRYDGDARIDLRSMVDWSVEQGASRRAALAYAARIEARFDRVGLSPEAGRQREDLGAGLRSVSFERSAIIIYRVEPDRVLILRVLRRGARRGGAVHTVTCAPISTTRPGGMRKKSVGLAALRSRKM